MSSFTALLGGEPTSNQIDQLGEALALPSSPTSITLGSQGGQWVAMVDFDLRKVAKTRAITDAIWVLESVGLTVLSLLDEDLVTLNDIAEKIGVSREAVRRWSTGDRGDGTFPPAVNPGRDGATFWRWSEVAPWLKAHGHKVEVDGALAAANMLLVAVRVLRGVPDGKVLLALAARLH